MFSLTWFDGNKTYVVVGVGHAIMAVYYMVIKNEYCKSIHAHDCETGLELDPETGLRDIVRATEPVKV